MQVLLLWNSGLGTEDNSFNQTLRFCAKINIEGGSISVLIYEYIYDTNKPNFKCSHWNFIIPKSQPC